jgi:rifampicin phosphotransferase
MQRILWFSDGEACRRESVGGKGANLGLLTAAGFPVPPGFVVTTDAYRDFIDAEGVGTDLRKILAAITYDDPTALERDTARIRDLITGPRSRRMSRWPCEARTPTCRRDRTPTWRCDPRGRPRTRPRRRSLDCTTRTSTSAVIDAIKRCWASLWTARATQYRHDKGFDHAEASLAVVVQSMVDADVAGVMFTGNPLNAANDEIVVNASWGLGESVVSGIVTPDEFILWAPTLEVRRETLGPKAVEIVRDPDSGSGTVKRDVDAIRQARPSLSPEQLHDLGRLGLKVQDHYGRMPQDIEWAFADGTFYLLQSRDVTGVTFAWDDDVDNTWQTLPDKNDYVWSRAYSDEYWTGAITPLFYSIRAREYTYSHNRSQKVMGHPDLAEMRIWKYRQAEAYYNSTFEKEFVPRSLPPFLRAPGTMAKTPSTWWDEVADAPFSLAKYLGIYARIAALEPDMGLNKWIDLVYDHIENRVPEGDGLSDDELRELSDDALTHYMDERIRFFSEFLVMFWPGFFIYAPGLLTLLGDLLARWYDGSNVNAYTDLVTGLPRQTITLRENEQLWRMTNMIRENDKLRAVFEEHPGAAFFQEADKHPECGAFMEEYRLLLRDHGHRGQADRDFWFPRRIENPASDYNSLKTILTSDSTVSPAEHEAEMRKRREDATEEIVANIRRKPLGWIKAEIFQLVLHHSHKFLTVRDDERHYIDRLTWSKKRVLLEINRRVMDRGLLERDDDFYFLSLEELDEVLENRHDERLVRAKIAGRRSNFDRFDRKEVFPPPYLYKGEGVDLDVAPDETGADDGVLRGMGTSRGTITGKARVVRGLDEIGRIEKDDIMICQATDPGWTPVFLVISGLVLETGGLLAHGSCLSREYGLPAVQIRDAMNLIPDGATITVNGETGEVTIDDGGNGGQPDQAALIAEPTS